MQMVDKSENVIINNYIIIIIIIIIYNYYNYNYKAIII